jgi:23S rRNA pseudouridine2604 synthase
MAKRKICSRREADSYIERGLVFVDGKKVEQLGTKCAPDAKIELKRADKKVTILLNKPVGFLSMPGDKDYPLAIDLITPENQEGKGEFSYEMFKKLAPAGRLDIDSKGLIVFTQDGVIVREIIGEMNRCEKEYLVRVEGKVTHEMVKKLTFGLELDGKALKRAEIEKIDTHLLKFVLTEGKKRQIRRMCELVGLKVVSLKRVRVGRVKLGKLPLGKWRFLENESF